MFFKSIPLKYLMLILVSEMRKHFNSGNINRLKSISLLSDQYFIYRDGLFWKGRLFFDKKQPQF
jgi:hypothetical protein